VDGLQVFLCSVICYYISLSITDTEIAEAHAAGASVSQGGFSHKDWNGSVSVLLPRSAGRAGRCEGKKTMKRIITLTTLLLAPRCPPR
jgi:hypothetical protein